MAGLIGLSLLTFCEIEEDEDDSTSLLASLFLLLPGTTTPSSDKAITAFTFRATDNSGISADVAGSISGSTIGVTLTFGVGVASTSLVPNIAITGASVSPASGVAQNFSSPVTYTVTALDGTTRDYTVTAVLDCPVGYIPVPANAAMGVTADFCSAKYKMKNNSGAKSEASGNPWVSIDRPTAIAACQALGSGYDLITNAQWQTIARNIENVASNWSGGSVGSGELNHGHADDNPNQACDAAQENVQTNCSSSGGASWNAEKRTHTLSNGEVIWDLAGNVWEWVKDDSSADFTGAPDNLSNGYVSQLTNATVKGLFGPQGDHTSLSSGNYGGLGFIIYGTTGAAFRGGRWNFAAGAGVFALDLVYGPSNSLLFVGFRCARGQ